jgi:transposase
MRDKELYQQILGIQTPWMVTEVEPSMTAGEVTVHVEYESGVRPTYPHCGMSAIM